MSDKKRRRVQRVAVGTLDGPRSSVWNVWIPGKKSDVYISARSTAGIMKASLHESGECRMAFTSQYQGYRPFAVDTRHWDIWVRPKVAPDTSLPLRLIIPSDALRLDLQDLTGPKRIAWIEPPGAGSGVEIDFLFCDGPLPAGVWPGQREPGTIPVASTVLPNGQQFWIVTCPLVIEGAMAEAVGIAKAVLKEQLFSSGKLTAPPPAGLVGMLYGQLGDGGRFMFEFNANVELARSNAMLEQPAP